MMRSSEIGPSRLTPPSFRVAAAKRMKTSPGNVLFFGCSGPIWSRASKMSPPDLNHPQQESDRLSGFVRGRGPMWAHSYKIDLTAAREPQ